MQTTITLNNGVEMPLVGYGVFQVDPAECERCVTDALAVGYRSVDTAQAYFNEEGVGRAWRKSGLAREELFLTTKVWVSNAGERKAAESIDLSLRKLQTDYIDLLLIHQAFGDYYGTYRAMEAALRAGKVRAIGVSNFYYDRFLDIAAHMEVKPAVNQIEVSALAQQWQMQELAAQHGTKLMAWGPLAEAAPELLANETLQRIAAAHGKTVAQVGLRFLTQRGIIAIPKTVRRERMEENLDCLGFDLSEEEMAAIRTLDIGHGHVLNFSDPQGMLTLFDIINKYKV
ncbi:MAG: aldo/keto reductase [Akkermansiaceae bacterium]|nr:aldo/keto reductase [Akkermansiaceae bacterium]